MTGSHAIPIIVGIGDVRNKSMKLEDAVEPAQLMATAIQKAVADTGLSETSQKKLLGDVDSLRVVPTWTWSYNDLPSYISSKVGIQPTTKVIPEHGGNQPALQCDEAARAISTRQSKVAVLTGGEALASLGACQKSGQMPPKGWLEPDPNGKGLTLDLSMLQEGPGTLHSMGLPIHVYPLYENARRAALGQSVQGNMNESAEMYSAFDKIACNNEYAWGYGDAEKSAATIASVTKRNRMICEPYPLLMNAFNGVNLSAACVLTSTEHAKELGIPESKWIYVLGGAGTHEKDRFWERRHFHDSPAICKSIDAALSVSGLASGDIDCFDFYSCFPIVPKLACDHLKLSTNKWEKPITLLGGLTSFGGAGNNYSMHAITAMARVMRNKQHKTGLILANGGMLTHQHVLCLSTTPRSDKQSYPDKNPLSPIEDDYSPPFAEKAEGPATIETFTVEYNRDGTPGMALIVGRLRDSNRRFLANHADEGTLKQLAGSSVEQIGQSGQVQHAEDGRNLFSLTAKTKL